MTPSTLIVEGVNIELGKRIGRGGEGEVFALVNDSDRALKMYTSQDGQQREAKITAIVNRKIAQQSSLVAFPLAIARHSDGRFAGFVMKRVNGHKPLFELYSPGARKKNFPKADFRFLIRAAANVSRAVASVHRTGCVIGDINHSGILISDEARVALIDADSFQFIDGPQKYLCRVGVPEYTPPELQGKKLGGIVRNSNHDAFGLAVVIFQLLFMGRHPFVGAFAKGDMPIERAIFEHRFAYSQQRDVGMTRPPGAASLADFPSEVAEAFERAFSPLSDGGLRPTAETWINILENLERSVTQCDKDNQHYYPSVAAECPWCRMEQQLGMLLFLPTFLNFGLPADDPGSGSFNLAAMWASIEQVHVPNPKALQPTLPVVKASPSREAKKVKSQVSRDKLIAIATLVLSAVALVLWSKFWLIWAATAIFGATKLLFKNNSQQLFLEKYFSAKENFEQSIDDWRTKCGINQILRIKSSLADARVQYENLEREKQLRVSMYQANHAKRHAMQLERFLESHEIRKAKIRHIGLARQTALASYGIETALDIIEEKVLAVPGFGMNNSIPLLEWRRNLEKTFVYDGKPNDLDKQEIQKIQFEIDIKGSELRKRLASGAVDLAQAAHVVTMQFKKEDPLVAQAYMEYKREKEDLVLLGVEVPKRRQPPRFGSNPFSLSGGTGEGMFKRSLSKMNVSGRANLNAGKPTKSSTNNRQPSSPASSLSGPTSSSATSGRQQSAPYSTSGNQPSSYSSSSGRYASGSSSTSGNPSNSRSGRPSFATNAPTSSAPSQVACPKCGSSMAKRISRRGKPDQTLFYGCSTYPSCKGIRPL